MAGRVRVRMKQHNLGRQLTMEEVVKSRVRTEVTSWKRRELAAPESRAPELLRRMACSSPANRLMRITLRALHTSPAALYAMASFWTHEQAAGLYMRLVIGRSCWSPYSTRSVPHSPNHMAVLLSL